MKNIKNVTIITVAVRIRRWRNGLEGGKGHRAQLMINNIYILSQLHVPMQYSTWIIHIDHALKEKHEVQVIYSILYFIIRHTTCVEDVAFQCMTG